MSAPGLPIDTAPATRIYPQPAEWCNGCTREHGHCEYCKGNFYSTVAQESGAQQYSGSFSTEEAQTKIQSDILEARENLSYIQSKLHTHGDLILSRWSKKSKEKRGALLSTAAGFCFGAWPPVTFTDPLPSTPLTAWCDKECREFVWPYACWIRAKDFAEDRMRLLTLLHLRTEHSLQSWVMHDTIESRAVFNKGLYVPYNPSCVEMFGEEYGRLVPFDNMLIHTCAIMSFPRTLVTISAQYQLSLALRRVVDDIVACASPSGNLKWSEFVLNNNKKGVETRWSFYEHPALVQPHGFDTKNLLDRAKGKFNELVDDMELLQTDPEYMLDFIFALKSSMRYEDYASTMTKWNLLAVKVLQCLTPRLTQWARMVDAFECVHEVFQKHHDNIRPGTALPPEVGMAMCTFAAVTHETGKLQYYTLMNAVYHMAALKDCFAIVKAESSFKWRHLRSLDPSRPSDCVIACAIGVQNGIRNEQLCGAISGKQYAKNGVTCKRLKVRFTLRHDS
jgi:hypothetical protein